ncbi:MAG: EAL domain-containing protein, partial [Gammaproteobacteria bacterium]|nr:EAL domain-containing protein [Gammaproteobacteria bacterium]
GKKQVVLPQANALETENLLLAYNRMREEIHSRQSELQYQAMHDSLTGLPNRNLMGEWLKHSLLLAKRENRNPALLLIDLNKFKDLNDTLGHQMGDQLLIELGERLSGLLRESDSVARLGGDEFAILIDDTDVPGAVNIAVKVLEAVQTPFDIGTNQLCISASIGIAIYPLHATTEQLMVQHADVAMYFAKRNNLGFKVYEPCIDENAVQNLSLVSELREAIKTDALELYFQPKINISNMSIHGVEALLRWNHPEHGFVPPDKIIALAEQSGLINQIFEWVFNKAALQVKSWLNSGLDIKMAVNLSLYDFQHHDVISFIEVALQKHKLPAEQFYLEVTENIMMENPGLSIEKLTAIDAMGLHISVDDFGTGYSSLSYLKKLPVDELKIDRSFVMEMDKDENDAIIVRSTIELAHNLGLQVVAEGVENQETLDRLIEFGCDSVQGFYLARPMPVSAFAEWLQEFRRLHVRKTG